MTVLVFASESPKSQSRISRDCYWFAEHVDRAHPYSSLDYHRDDQAWVCLRETAGRSDSRVIPLPFIDLPPTFLVYRPIVANAAFLAEEICILRTSVDTCWRNRAMRVIARMYEESAPTRLRLEAALSSSSIALRVAQYCRTLPPWARRVRRMSARAGKGVNLHMKEVLDWTLYLRVAAGRDIGVTLAQRVVELGSSLRSFRRVCRRLRPLISLPPKRVSPQMVIDALVRRLTPPPERYVNARG